MSNSKVAKRASAELIEFSDSIKPSKKYITEGTKKVEKVINKLKELHKSISKHEKEISEDIRATEGSLNRFKVDRAVYGGSIGKQTSVIYPDFDCVVFLNDVNPSLTGFLEEFKTILEEHAQDLSIIPQSVKLKRITVQARFENGVEMDLLAACNFSQDPDEQHKLVLKNIRRDPSNSRQYSSSLAKLQLSFMKTQSSFTHQLIRLAKYWYKSLSLDDYVYGGSAMMEILCATVIAQNPACNSMLEAFKKFLQKIVAMNTLQIAFIHVEDKNKWKFIENEEIMKFRNHFDLNIISRSNYIIEPANPYNDMVNNISPQVFAKLAKFARKMLERVAQLEDYKTNDIIIVVGQMLASIDISKLFEPFPLRLIDEYSEENLPTEALVDYQYEKYTYNSAEPQFIPNNPSFDDDKYKQRKLVTNVILNNLAFLIRAPRRKEFGDKTYISYTDGVAHVSLNEVKSAVERLTSDNFKFKESNSDRDHTGYDVTVYAPYNCDDRKYAVRLSLKWSSSGPCVVM